MREAEPPHVTAKPRGQLPANGEAVKLARNLGVSYSTYEKGVLSRIISVINPPYEPWVKQFPPNPDEPFTLIVRHFGWELWSRQYNGFEKVKIRGIGFFQSELAATQRPLTKALALSAPSSPNTPSITTTPLFLFFLLFSFSPHPPRCYHHHTSLHCSIYNHIHCNGRRREGRKPPSVQWAKVRQRRWWRTQAVRRRAKGLHLRKAWPGEWGRVCQLSRVHLILLWRSAKKVGRVDGGRWCSQEALVEVLVSWSEVG